MPWRNGGGTTSEILAEPGPGGRFRFRLSVAEVASSGPFSDFGGYDRHILLLEGEGFTLRVDGSEPAVLDRPLVPFAFDGGRAARCELHGGSVRDLNLMVDRATACGSLGVLRIAPGDEAELPLAETVLAYVVSGCVDAGGIRLDPGDTLRVEPRHGERLRARVDGGATVVVATIDPARRGGLRRVPSGRRRTPGRGARLPP